ncbi:pirin family protein [Aquitalea denitrificans]|uniref:pirin family protein n=1 Tax=Aquitalea denitrificans TaxID=519081 RepID=UPI00135B0DDF|nr:pirin family protein [Aquitalea denitrificans]
MHTWSERISAKISDIGFPVRRLLPSRSARHIGPFIFLDHMGPAHFNLTERDNDVRPHPHIGLATLTYLFSGALMHRDSLGSVQRIEPGAANLMLAGRGIVHSERIPDDIRSNGMAVEGLQLWLALPVELEECAPAFMHYGSNELPTWQQDGSRIQLVLGSAWGRNSPVVFPGEALYAVVEMAAGTTLEIPTGFAERGIYLASGSLSLGGEHLVSGELGLLPDTATPLRITAREPSRLALLAGPTPDAHRILDWNFVSTRLERIRQARDDWQQGRFPAVPGETEFIPLPTRG